MNTDWAYYQCVIQFRVRVNTETGKTETEIVKKFTNPFNGAQNFKKVTKKKKPVKQLTTINTGEVYL